MLLVNSHLGYLEQPKNFPNLPSFVLKIPPQRGHLITGTLVIIGLLAGLQVLPQPHLAGTTCLADRL